MDADRDLHGSPERGPGGRAVPEVVELGDAAFLLRFGAGGERRALALAQAVRRSRASGLHEVTVAYATVAVYFDPLATAAATLVDIALEATERLRGTDPGGGDDTLHTLSVRYDGQDLSEVARTCGLSLASVVELHAAAEYRVRAVGFVPGFAYLGEVDERLRLPRRAAPRPRVPAGAVAIAGEQTAVYPFATPGGWHLIGRTDTTLFDPRRDPPSLLSVGARVRFVPS